jgi:hypothetical protein
LSLFERFTEKGHYSPSLTASPPGALLALWAREPGSPIGSLLTIFDTARLLAHSKPVSPFTEYNNSYGMLPR